MALRGFAARMARAKAGFVSARPLYLLGGLNEDENPRAVPPGDLVRAINTARNGSLTGTRPGVTYGDADWNAAHSSGAAVQGIHQYSWGAGANRKIVAVINGNVYDEVGGTLIDKTATSIEAGASYQWTFADFQDKMFAAGGDTASDGVWYWDGTNPLGEINFSFTTSPKYIFEKWNFLFVSGLTGSSYDDNPMVWRYCDYGSDATDVANWPSTNVIPGQLLNENFGVGSYGGEYSTGMGEFSGKDADFMLLLTNKRIFVMGQNDPGLITGSETAFASVSTIPVGCVSQNAFVNLGADAGDAVFLSQDGVHSLARSRQYGDNESAYLSWKIRSTWQTLNRSRLDEAWGAYWPSEGMVIFSVATGSSATNNLLLVMDIKGLQNITPDAVRWYKWELNGITPNCLRLCRGSDNRPYVYVGGTAGEVCRFDRDTYQDLSSSGTIAMDFITKHDDFELPSKDKKIGDCFVVLRGSGGGTVQHTIMEDDGRKAGYTSALDVPASAATWGAGNGTWGVSQWGGESAIARHRVPATGSSVTVGHRFTRTAANAPVFIGLIDQQIDGGGSTQDANANTGS